MKIYEIILWSLLISSLISAGYFLNPLIENAQENKETKLEVIDYKECSNLSVTNTTECLVNYVKSIYNYTVRSDEERTLEDIKINGGDCYDYSILYEKWLKV